MEQTKESFEKYLEDCRKANTWGKRPPEEEINCPFCETGKARLHELPLEHWVVPHVWKGTIWGYDCLLCGESFTTTESDTVTLASLKLIP